MTRTPIRERFPRLYRLALWTVGMWGAWMFVTSAPRWAVGLTLMLGAAAIRVLEEALDDLDRKDD